MTPEEAVILVRYVRACCPQQRLDEYTPDAWHDLLSDLSLDDAHAAVVEVAKRQPFVAPAEIHAQVRAAREERLQRTPVEAPHHDLTDDPRRYVAGLQDNIQSIADGFALPKAVERAEPSQAMTTRHTRDARRIRSLLVPCPWCHVYAGAPCVNAVGDPVSSIAAHDARLVAAGLARWAEGPYQRAMPISSEQAS